MIPLSPFAVTSPHAGLKFSKSAGHLFRPIFLDESGTALLWDREFSGILRLSPNFARFLADVEFAEGGDEVIFSRFEGGKDVLTGTSGLCQGVGLPRGLYLQLLKAESEFKRSAEHGMFSERQAEFARAFALPDPIEFPAAYRVRKAGIFSRKKLYVLWGMVPEGPRKQPTIRMGEGFVSDSLGEDDDGVFSDMGTHAAGVPVDAPSPAEEVAYDEESEWPRWLQLLLWGLGFLLLLAILWLLFSLLMNSCEREDSRSVSSHSPLENRSEASEAIPPIEKRKPLLQKRIDSLGKGPDSPANQQRKIAIQDAARKQELAKVADHAYRKTEAAADAARKKADETNNPEDKAEADRLGREAKDRKAESDQAHGKAEDAFRSPQEAKRRDDLEAASPADRQELKSKFYVSPKNSSEEGEIMVRRFMPDEIVPKKGLRLHLEAEANGRRDFKVRGWRLGVGPLVEKDRLEEFVPVGPELNVDVPLDLSFVYRGDDGQMHEDTAPFTLKGDLEIVPRIEIERYKENADDPSAKPSPERKADPRLGA